MEEEAKRKFTRLQESAFQKLWHWNYLQRFPIALYAPLCALVEQLEDAPLEAFLSILEALIAEREKRKTVFPSGGRCETITFKGVSLEGVEKPAQSLKWEHELPLPESQNLLLPPQLLDKIAQSMSKTFEITSHAPNSNTESKHQP